MYVQFSKSLIFFRYTYNFAKMTCDWPKSNTMWTPTQFWANPFATQVKSTKRETSHLD